MAKFKVEVKDTRIVEVDAENAADAKTAASFGYGHIVSEVGSVSIYEGKTEVPTRLIEVTTTYSEIYRVEGHTFHQAEENLETGRCTLVSNSSPEPQVSVRDITNTPVYLDGIRITDV